MEDELRCPNCKQFFENPVLLPCFHGLCFNCANELTLSGRGNNGRKKNPGSSASSTTSDQDDKVSLSSEADSGVVADPPPPPGRPNSFASTPSCQLPVAPPSVSSLACPACRKLCLFDESGARNLPRYRLVQSIIERRCSSSSSSPSCEMCDSEPPRPAVVVCEQCAVHYCEPCRELCHPARGPLAKHNLVKPVQSLSSAQSPTRDAMLCSDHAEQLQFFCVTCKVPACQLCINVNRHGTHDVQPIIGISKAQKTELSQNLQQLSEKAKSTTEFIQRLKNMSDAVSESSLDCENIVAAQCDALLLAIEDKRDQLIEMLRKQRDAKLRRLKEEQAKCTGKLQQTTGLIQFCIEALKEVDAAAFMQVGNSLITRVANTDLTWRQEITDAAPRVSPVVGFSLDDLEVVKAIENLSFINAVVTATILPEKCLAENNSITVCWTVPDEDFVDGYVLEIDDGDGGDFREVYCGKEDICTVDGLHFDSVYKARVKAFNSYGEGKYSDLVCLQTAEVAWFTFEPRLSAPDLLFFDDNRTVTAGGFEHRVALGSVGFSRGVHYWEVVIDKYSADTDPAIGVCRIDVCRDMMLGKEEKGFAMYIDWKRSWFQHNGVHERRMEGGIQAGATVGVLLDLTRHCIRFLVNGVPQGGMAFGDLYGVFYPAVSVNRGVTLRLQTGMKAPVIRELFE